VVRLRVAELMINSERLAEEGMGFIEPTETLAGGSTARRPQARRGGAEG